MPDLRNCRRCGRMYTYIGGQPICPDCKKADEEIFKKVKEFLYDNPGATLSQVAITLEVSVEKIKMFLREGRLEITEGTNIILECERCGKAIKTGRYCDMCQHEMTTNFKQSIAPSLQPIDKKNEQVIDRQKTSGMRYLNRN